MDYRFFKSFLKTFVLLKFLIVFILLKKVFFFLPKNNFSTLYLIILLFILVNLMYYFSNIYKYSNYTSATQRFWKRTFGLFWLIEGFLFFCFLYLFLISPQEVFVFLDSNKQNIFFINTQHTALTQLLYSLILIVSFFFLFFLKKNNKCAIVLVSTIMIFISIFLFLNELKKLTGMLSYLQKLNINFIDRKSVGNLVLSTTDFHIGDTIDKNLISNEVTLNNIVGFGNTKRIYRFRTEISYISLILFLKFWHVFLIFIFFLFFFKKVINDPLRLSMDLISSNLQNSIYMYFFILLNFLPLIKKFFNVFLSKIYFWSLIDFSFIKTLNFLVVETLFLIR